MVLGPRHALEDDSRDPVSLLVSSSLPCSARTSSSRKAGTNLGIS